MLAAGLCGEVVCAGAPWAQKLMSAETTRALSSQKRGPGCFSSGRQYADGATWGAVAALGSDLIARLHPDLVGADDAWLVGWFADVPNSWEIATVCKASTSSPA
jgi:hypothetical protein